MASLVSISDSQAFDISGKVHLKSRSDKRVRAGHLWIFSNDLEDGFQNQEPGALVEVLDHRKQFVGIGTLNPHSLIAVRLLTLEKTSIDEGFFRQQLDSALALRQHVFGPADEVYRLVFSESDGLPGLIIDRFQDVLVIQVLTAGMERLWRTPVSLLNEMFEIRDCVLAFDSPMRAYEGLELKRFLLRDELHGLHPFEQEGIQFLMDAMGGQKTGFFLDQRANRKLLQSFVRRNATVLDLFCYSGAFGLYALQSGAGHTTFVDASEKALGLASEIAEKNGWKNQSEFVKADIFPWLKETSEKYDVVILDPPALAKNRNKVGAALRAYTDLNANALRHVKPDGIFATSSCSGLVSREEWRSCLRQASHKSGRRLRILAQGGQSPDHPMLASMPETDYLKFAIAVVD
jgi:23S rRNA (cytosine1962-C5)-methyltransferase